MKKLFALLLSIVFVLSTIAVTAFAVTDNKATETAYSAVSRLAKDPSHMPDIEIVPHKKNNPKRSAVWDGSIANGFAGGTGTEEDPYLISDGAELAYLAQEVNNGNRYSGVYFKLTNDIYLNDTSDWESWGNDTAPENEWTAIGTQENPLTCAYFNGDGYAVRGIYMDNREATYSGLFGYFGDDSHEPIIANLGVAESYINSRSYSSFGGGVVGYNCGSIINCYNSGQVCSYQTVGGVVGFNFGYISNCYNEGEITGGASVGGVAGKNTMQISNSYNAAPINGTFSVGGISGDNAGCISDCYNTGAISGIEGIAGIAGCSWFSNPEIGYPPFEVANCYNTGEVSGLLSLDGVAANSDDEYFIVTNCYYLIDCCRIGSSCGTPLTMEELMLAESFVGFDFSSVWTMDGNPDYPYPELIGNIHVGTSIVSPEPGDANGDGRVTMADATIIARIALNLAVSAPAADFDGDGRVTMADATLTARKALNLI